MTFGLCAPETCRGSLQRWVLTVRLAVIWDGECLAARAGTRLRHGRRRPGDAGPPGMALARAAVRVLRAGLDRALAGSGDVAGAAAGQAAARVAGHGRIVAEFFDVGYSRTLAWARRPQAAALVAALADPDRGWDAVVIGEYERAFYGSQYASMAPCSSTTASS